MLRIGYRFGIRSERRLCEEVPLNLSYRWFFRLDLNDRIPYHSTFSKNRHGRFRERELLRHLFETTVARCIAEGLVSGQRLNAAEIEVVQGLYPNPKAILVTGAIEEGDDNRFFEIAEETPRAIVFYVSPGALVLTGIFIAAEIAIRGYATLVLVWGGWLSLDLGDHVVAGMRHYMSPDADISAHAAYRIRNSTEGII